MRSLSNVWFALLPLALLACSDGQAENGERVADAKPASTAPAQTPPDAQKPADAQNPAAKPAAAPAAEHAIHDPKIDFAPGGPVSDEALSDYYVEMSCAVDGKDAGTMTIALWPKLAPITVRNFLRLCDVGFYDGVAFHRILRNFMVQGGDPTGTGGGESPFGTIQAEFSDTPERAHGYGVLSMARKGGLPDSAGAQFFLCCDESQDVWTLDGQYASFGKITSGVATLEALANTPVQGGMGGPPSQPAVEAKIVRAAVKKGAPPAGEKIERPKPDLGDQPERVEVQHVLISFRGASPQVKATRTKEEAEALAEKVRERAEAGEDFSALVIEVSDDPPQKDAETPGVYLLRNRGVHDLAAERALFKSQMAAQKEMQAFVQQVQAGEKTQEEFQARRDEIAAELTKAFLAVGASRDQMVPGFGDLAFSLEVGDVGIVPYDAKSSPFGWHVLKRLE